MILCLLCLLSLLYCTAVPLSAAAAASTSTYTYFLGKPSLDDQVLIFTLQGLANRNTSQLFLDTSSVFWQYPPSDQYFMTYLSETKGYQFNTLGSICDIVNQFRDIVQGVVVYDEHLDATRWIAVSLAALENLLPVTETQRNQMNCLNAFPIRTNLTSQFPSSIMAYNWAIANILPNCSTKSMAYSAGQSHDDVFLGGDSAAVLIGLDFPVSQRAFVFNLSPDEQKYPDDAKLFDKIMFSLDPLAAIIGWAEPEPLYTERISRNGGFVICDAAPNLSFWSTVPTQPGLKLPGVPASNRTLEKKWYLTFQTNEGDTPKIVAGLMAGEWLSPYRGKVPIGWGIDPYIIKKFPGLLEYYINSAQPTDTFFAGCSGAGYTYPRFMRDFDDYSKDASALLDATFPPIKIVDVWNEGPYDAALLEEYKAMAPNVDAFTFAQQTALGKAGNHWLQDGTPVFVADQRLWYPQLDPNRPYEDLEERIFQVANYTQPPFFVVIYGLLDPHFPHASTSYAAYEMMKRLPVEQFEVIGTTEMAIMGKNLYMSNKK